MSVLRNLRDVYRVNSSCEGTRYKNIYGGELLLNLKNIYEGKFQKSYEELSRVENYCDTIKRPIEESFEKVMKSVKKLEKS